MTDDYDHFKNKRTDRVYLSRSLEQPVFRKSDSGEVEELKRPFRIVSKVIDGQESHEFFRDGKQVSLRITDGARQEITAKFYEDNRGIFTLQIQRYTVESGMPHSTNFTFLGPEIATLYNFIRNVALLPLKSNESAKLDDRFVADLVLTQEQALNLLGSDAALFDALLRTQVTARDVAELGHRRKQNAEFEALLTDAVAFEARRATLGQNKRPEDVWQDFFEQSTWIFGFGLNYVFNSALNGEKFEQVVLGHNFLTRGKGLMRSAGLALRMLVSESGMGVIPFWR